MYFPATTVTDLNNALRTRDITKIEAASKAFTVKISARIVIYFVITLAINIFCWVIGIMFSAVYRNYVGSWLLCSFVSILLMIMFELIGVLLKTLFWSISIAIKNTYRNLICRFLARFGQFLTIIFNLSLGTSIWLSY
jgi:hypothetical protein